MEVAKTPTSPKFSTEEPATMSAMTVREKFTHMRKHYGIPFLIYWTVSPIDSSSNPKQLTGAVTGHVGCNRGDHLLGHRVGYD